MLNKKVLVSGASIAGPALAYWLERYGCTVTIVEQADALRGGGQAVDFKGETHRTVLDRMGILDEVHRRSTTPTDLHIIDESERVRATMPAEFIGGDVEILRGDLTELLYERTSGTCEYIFGDRITSLTETSSGVDVTFEHGEPRTFDLVFGADGIHSGVRRLAFGPEDDFVQFRGYYYAVVGGDPERKPTVVDANGHASGLMYNEPGVLAMVGGPKAPELFVFASEKVNYDRRDIARQKQIVSDAYRGAGWRVPEMMRAMNDDPEFYLDSLSRVRMDTYSSGRVALLGDAAYGNTLGGFGTGLAIVAAYVIAGELAAADGDHETAFRRYNQLFHRYAKVARSGDAGPFLAPRTPLSMRMRNWTFAFTLPMKLMMKMTDAFATDIRLPDYSHVPTVTSPTARA
jgi:2-polyprenyl-6-methoxyphenol hydroxylase-like FAD-dependent oxidoreductase